MENKAKDMCPRCKYCLGMTPQGMYSCGKANDGSELNIGIDVVLNCANFEWKDGKVEGKASDICPKCKNCKGIIQEYNGKTASIRLTEVECEDPYDGMIKTLAADSDVCCSMFEVRKEKEPFNLNMPREAIKAIAKLNDVICELEKEKAAHLKGIERLKKTQEKLQNQVKNLQTTNEESYKREEKLEEKFKEANELADSWKRDYEFVRDRLIHPIYDILYPDNPNRDINVTDFLSKIKDLKVYGDENGSMYKELQEWRKKCIARDIDVDRLLSVNKELEKKYRDEISKLQNIVTEKHAEIKGLKRDIIVLHQNKFLADTAMKKNNKLRQTISDQEVTIKALLITIKEMCKEDETNE